MAPKAIVILLLAGFLAFAAARWREMDRLALPDRQSCAALGLLVGWFLISSAWSFEPAEAALRSLRVGFVMFVGLLFVRLIWETPPEDARRALRWLGLGIVVALALIAEELLFGHPLFIAVKGSAENAYLEVSRLNRGASALAMLGWLAAAGLVLQGHKATAAVGLAATGALLGCLESSAAILAFCSAAVVLLVGLAGRKTARVLLLFSAAALLFASPGLAKLFHHAGLSERPGLQTTARERVYMWNFTADRIFEKPVFGWGFSASKDMPNGDVAPFYPNPNKAKKKKIRSKAPPHRNIITHHPHNAGLQILLELGLVGAALAAAVLWIFFRRLESLPAAILPWARASALAALVVAGTAYGIWQNQWLAVIAANAAVIALLGAAARPAQEPPT